MKQARLSRLAQALAVAGAMALAGTAHALDYTGSSMNFGPFQGLGLTDTWTVGDLQLTGFAFDPTSTFSGLGAFPEVQLAQVGDIYNFVFDPDSTATLGSGSLTYTVKALNGKILGSAETGWVGVNGIPTGTLSLSDGTNTVTAYSNASPSVPPLALSGYTVDLTTTWDASGTSTFTTLQNNIALVPAPLPILGALAAFGWSRKLRRRVRAAPAGLSADKGLALAA